MEADANDQSVPLGWRSRKAEENPGLPGDTKLLDTGTQRLAEDAGLWSKCQRIMKSKSKANSWFQRSLKDGGGVGS